jgi:glycosyltransferase involved in cell wall biosynthesis
MDLLSIVIPCYNEEDNVREVYAQVNQVLDEVGRYDREFIFIDNASTDKTVGILREMAQRDKRVKVIVNARNFGHIRSPYYAMLQSSGAAVIGMAADLQDPPVLIKDFVKKWEQGFKVVVGVKTQSEESPIIFALRRVYYSTLHRLSDIELIENFTGFGLYDRQVIELLKAVNDPYPYFRGLIAELGFETAKVEFVQPTRKRGITKNNFYTLYDMAMLGMTNHSKIPLRLATMLGFLVAVFSLLVAFIYLVYKLLYWNNFSVGQAPLVIGIFFFSAVQLFFLGIVGEYVGSIQTQVLRRPLVVEKERINF